MRSRGGTQHRKLCWVGCTEMLHMYIHRRDVLSGRTHRETSTSFWFVINASITAMFYLHHTIIGYTIIGYTHTDKEADDICKKNNNYSWDYSTIIKSKIGRIKLYNSLPQLCILLYVKPHYYEFH